MPSLKAQILCFALRHRNTMPWKRNMPVKDWSSYDAIVEFRETVEKGAGRFGRLPKGMDLLPLTIGNIAAEWLTPAGSPKSPVIMYFHGGGYVSGSIPSHRAIVAKFARRSGLAALLFDYRLAPENPFPAALEDALQVYSWLLEQGRQASDIAFIGDSGGGGLALATLLALRDQGQPLPAAASVMSPVTDFTCSGASYTYNLKRCLSPEGMGVAAGRHYAGAHDVTHPYISPLFGDLHGLPPLLIYAGGDETLLDDAVRFAEKAARAGVDSRLEVGEGLFHCYPACAPMFPEATRALADICIFTRQHLKYDNQYQ